jgi:hypothetical protein
MDLRCFVRVLSEEGDALGTGYLISRDRVLTAAHVVGDAERVAIEYDDRDEKDVAHEAATVHWCGDDLCDVALLLLAAPVAVDVPLPHLVDTPARTLTPWESRGWALASEQELQVRDSMIDLHGDASAFAAKQKRFQLTIDVKLKRADLWQGASGAPVFERATNRILGVVAEAPKVAENLWYASPLSAAFLRGDFLEKLGGEIVRERRERLIGAVRAVLASSAELAEALSSCHEGWRKADSAALADAVLATDVVEVLTRLNTLHSRLCREGAAAAWEVEQIVALIAPILVQSRVFHALPNETGGVWLRLPVRTVTVADLAVASFDGRPSVLEALEDDYPVGRGRLPPPPPEVGFDVDGKASERGYADHFERLLPESDRTQAERERLRGNEEKALDLVFGLVDDELEFQAEHGDPPLRHYFLYDDLFARDNHAFLARLRRRIRSIHLVEMAGDDLRGERRICRPLREILARAAQSLQGGAPRP